CALRDTLHVSIPPLHNCLLILLSTPPRPPRSPLFPYTTLFRSPRLRAAAVPPFAGEFKTLIRASRSAHSRATRTVASLEQSSTTDRKSTRLNSSHQIISYAVFCLKKKKQTQKH